MKKEYLNIYNNLIKLTRNKLLFEKITNEDSFSHKGKNSLCNSGPL